MGFVAKEPMVCRLFAGGDWVPNFSSAPPLVVARVSEIGDSRMLANATASLFRYNRSDAVTLAAWINSMRRYLLPCFRPRAAARCEPARTGSWAEPDRSGPDLLAVVY